MFALSSWIFGDFLKILLKILEIEGMNILPSQQEKNMCLKSVNHTDTRAHTHTIDKYRLCMYMMLMFITDVARMIYFLWFFNIHHILNIIVFTAQTL